MGKRSRLKRHGGNTVYCGKCRLPIPFWPKGGAVIENECATEQMKVCTKCLGIILNMPRVQVIKSNVGHD